MYNTPWAFATLENAKNLNRFTNSEYPYIDSNRFGLPLYMIAHVDYTASEHDSTPKVYPLKGGCSTDSLTTV